MSERGFIKLATDGNFFEDYKWKEVTYIHESKYNKLHEFVKSIAENEVHSSRVAWMMSDRAKEILKEIEG